VDIEEIELASPDADDQLLAVNDALDKLAAQTRRGGTGQAPVFRGLTTKRPPDCWASPRARPGITGHMPDLALSRDRGPRSLISHRNAV